MVLSIIFLIVGVLLFMLGGGILKLKASRFLVWFDFNKYDNDKVTSIISCHLMLLGVALIAISRINYVLINEYSSFIAIIVLLLGIATGLSSCYQIYKYGKIDDRY